LHLSLHSSLGVSHPSTEGHEEEALVELRQSPPSKLVIELLHWV